MVTAYDHKDSQFCWEFPVDPFTRKVIYDKKNVDSIFSNAKFDLCVLRHIDPRLHHRLLVKKHTIHDTQQLSHIFDSSEKKGLKEQGIVRLGIIDTAEKELETETKKARTLADKYGFLTASKTNTPNLEGTYFRADYWVPKALATHLEYPSTHRWHTVCSDYGIQDPMLSLKLFFYFQENLGEYWDVYLKHQPVTPMIARVEDRGVHVLPTQLNLVHEKYVQMLKTEIANLHSVSPLQEFNHRSPKALNTILFDIFKFEPTVYGKTGPSTNKDVIAEYSKDEKNPEGAAFCKQLRLVRKIEHTISFLENYKRNAIDNRLFSSINVNGTSTVRMSSSNPNTTNVGKKENPFEEEKPFKLREVFGPDDDHIWFCGDYSQFQIRIFAFAANDKYLLTQLENGEDCHAAVAKRMYETDSPDELQRRAAKAINFGILFGAGKSKIENMSGVKGSFDLYVRQFPAVFSYLDKCASIAKQYGFIETVGGYPLRVPRDAKYKAANYAIQGTEAEIVKTAMVRIDEYLQSIRSSLYMILPVHDEIVLEGLRKYNYRKQISKIQSIMVEESERLGIPASVDFKYTTTHWSATSEYC
jgi:DNA polymerase I-like protein with 3'-5' exonuclease and polymerase domains